MALTDLTNTAWVLNNQLSSYAGGSSSVKRYNVDIVTEEATAGLSGLYDPTDTFTEIAIGYGGAEQNQVSFYSSQARASYIFANGHDTETLPDTWVDYIDIPFTITGGDDVTNSDLIAWLESNATPYTPQYYVSSIQLTDGTKCIIKDTFGRQSIPYGMVTSDSTTVFTATVDGVTELSNGVCCLIRNNNKQTSASGWTLNVNELGAKPVYNNMADATRDTTIFNKVYTMLFVYDEDRVDGGCWICYRGYNSDNNTIGYQIRHNSSTLNVTQKTYRYRLLFTGVSLNTLVPANTSTSTSATAAKSVNSTPINPFAPIYYYGYTSAVSANASPSAVYLWQQYAVNLGYSFTNATALALTSKLPVFLKCAPQNDGSAIIDSTEPIVQALPSSADGKIYILLGIAYSATNLELCIEHPVFYYDGTAIRLWTGASGGSSSVAWNDITGKPTFATVATSGSYNDLSDKPTIPSLPDIMTVAEVDALFT